jgi:hypothetical protein
MTAVSIPTLIESDFAPSALNTSKRGTNCTGCYVRRSGNAAALMLTVPEPPGYMHEQMAEGWRRSWAIRQELEAAAADIKRNGRFAK